MAHFAQLDENNIVIKVIVVNNEVINNLPFPESEPIGVAFCQSLFGEDTQWKQTSYNSSFRGTYVGIGMKYHSEFDVFGSIEASYTPEEEQEINQDLIGVTRI